MIVKKWMLCLLVAALLALAAGTALATTENLWVTVYYDQDGAREMLDEVNAFRTGSDAWYWSGENVKQSVTGLSTLNYDYFLEQAAMQLAVECAFDASGNRTDGSHYMSLVNGQGYSYSAYGSCRGSGKATASEMLAQMLADDTGYYSQRCRDLLLKDYYNCMGVGHAQFNDNDYWVMILCKSNDGKGYTPTTAVNSYKEVKVPFDLDSDTIGINVTLTDAPEVLELYMTDIGLNGKATQLPTHMAVQLYNKGSTPAVYKPGLVKLKLPYPVWTVSGDCVKINPNNTQSLLPLKQGEGIASTTVLGNKLNVNVAVVPRDIKDALVSAPDQVFDGTPKKPGPIVLLDGVQLKEGAEDTNDVEVVGRTNNMYPGTATVTVAGKGKYKGEATGTYRILPANLSLVSVSAPSVTYTGAAQTPGFEATYMGMTLIQGTDYDIAYSNNTNAGTGAVTLTGKGYYTGTLNESFAINPASLASAEWTDIPDQTWTGAALTPALSLSFNGAALAAGADYDAAWSNNTNLGKASVTLTGKGNFAGSLTKEFNIVAASLSGASIADIPAQDYTGAAIQPALTVKLGSATLKAGTDYTVEYENNVAKGTATIYVDGKGFYDSWAEGTFSIVDHIALSQCSISRISNQYYTGSALKPKPTVSYDGKKLREGVDYTLTYSKNKAIGKATVSIKGKGSYTGSVNRSFSIVLDKGTWKQSGGKWWYSFAHGGYPKSVLLTIGGSTYYFDKSGYVVTGWKELSNGWHYFKSSGAMAKGWQQVGSSWYYFGKGGVMLTGWQSLSGKRYWFASSGAMATGWKQIGGKYYYFENSGAMAKSKWVGNYYLQADGTMAVNKWIGKYHVNASGKWDKTR